MIGLQRASNLTQQVSNLANRMVGFNPTRPGGDAEKTETGKSNEPDTAMKAENKTQEVSATVTAIVVAAPVPEEEGAAIAEEETVGAAQRQAMRDEGIPTSQQPDSQVSTEAGRQYTYTVPKEGGGTETKIVTRQHVDSNHSSHVEAGRPKANGQTDPSGRLRHSNDKTKVNIKQKDQS